MNERTLESDFGDENAKHCFSFERILARLVPAVAWTGSQPVLAVKIGDRLCNTRDFLRLEGAGRDKARDYFVVGQPLFDHFGKTKFPSEQLPKGMEAAIRAEIEQVRNEIEYAVRS